MKSLPKNMTYKKLEIAQYTADGCSAKRTAQQMGLTAEGVYAHLKEMRMMEGATNTTHLITILLRKKLIR